jgi:GntR family transcriptional regulator/MocR family aminotransferase
MDAMTPKFFTLPEDSHLGLRDQICEMVSSAITSQALSLDKRLPSCRELADQLDVSRNTVFAAYNRLIDLGLLVSRNRSGYFVNPIALSMPVAKKEPNKASIDQSSQSSPVEFSPLNLIPIDNPLNWTSYPYPFIYNQIDPNLFPVDSWRECSRLALSRTQMPAWRDDSVESDSSQLIQQLRQRLLSSRGIYTEEDEILITLGAQNALFIIGTMFSNRNLPIAIEDPGFFGARNAFQLTGNQLVGIPVDNEGLDVSAIPDDCQLVFTTPSHQFPTMITMTQSRRKQLLKAAVKQDFIIVEDDYEAEMNYFNSRSQSLRSLDKNNRVIYIGSLSKTVSPGIRLGFMVAHRDIIRQARVVRGVMMRHPPTIVQEVVALFFRLGYYDSHLRNIERRYKKRWHVMREAITLHLSMLEQTLSEGGTSFWLRGPEGFNATELGERLRDRGVLIDIGEKFYLDGDQRSFRLGFAFVPMKKLEQGIQIIAEEVKKML